MNYQLKIVTALLLFFGFTTTLISQLNPGPSIPDSVSVAAESVSISETSPIAVNLAQPEWSITRDKVIWAILVALIGFALIKYLSRLLERLGERWIKFRLTIKGLVPILRIAGWIIILYIIIVDLLAPPIATIVALTASAGIAVGFASQDILKNIFGGIMILFDRPFQVGDKIQVGSHYGEVVGIGMRTVRITSPDDSLVSIPNSEIVNTSVSNSNSGEHYCQVVSEVYLQPDVDLTAVRKLAYEAAAMSQYIYLNKPIQIIIKNEIHQGQSLLKLRLKAYVLDIRYEFAFASQMTEILLGQLSQAQLPFTPTEIPHNK
ncbi:MAG: mechanosensitive ion channel family protein [Candidatus Marinimicrobia bacterium]|nr:mechanosensitive ion channel family protein [Candidatus Neomarinimicrobiota bacterium]MCF7921847.1 mechanosensitive ion channel family protein [Candidatus Neomarinimicrobiota bacterium]